MRARGSNSMYQQGGRPTQQGGRSVQQGGIVNNKSMAVSKLMVTGGMGQGLAGKSMLANRSMKKVEGQDFGKTNKSTFQQTVSNLKNKPTQKVLEDEYIGGLQEEIKYLQYELKLLKDKQIMQREGVNELDNFLKDEIPINQNILAMKNKYNATKAKLEQQLSSLNMKKSEAEDVLKTQKSQIDRLHQIIDGHRKQKGDRNDEYRQKLGQYSLIMKEITLAVDEYEAVGNESRRMNEKVKKMHEEISLIIRQNEKEKIAEVRANEDMTKKRQKFEELFKKNKEDMIETTQQCEELSQLEDTNPLLKPLEDQNSSLRKRIMLNQKQRSTAQNTIAEIELFLQEEEREREIERQHKGKYLTVIEDCRVELQNIEREGDNILKDQTLRAKKVMIKEMNNEFAQKDDFYNLLSNRLRTLEQECSNLIQQKKEFTDTIETLTKTEKEIQQQIGETEEFVANSRSTTNSLQRITQVIGGDIIEVENELEKAKGRLPIVQREIERKSITIHYLNKQVDLLKELKALDLEQLHMISMSGSSMQNILSSFIKNWEKIKSQ